MAQRKKLTSKTHL